MMKIYKETRLNKLNVIGTVTKAFSSFPFDFQQLSTTFVAKKIHSSFVFTFMRRVLSIKEYFDRAIIFKKVTRFEKCLALLQF